MQGVGVESQQLQDRRRYLGCLDLSVELIWVDRVRGVDDDRHVPVGWVIAAVLGDLGAAGVDDTDLDPAEHVRVSRIGLRHTEEVLDEVGRILRLDRSVALPQVVVGARDDQVALVTRLRRR